MLVAQVQIKSKANEQRWNVRRPVSLETSAAHEDDGYSVTIQNLSENGLMFETWGADIAVGDTIEISLPAFDSCTAEVVWARGHSYGCRFFAPIPKAIVSAAVLKSPFFDTREDIDERPTYADRWLEDDQRQQPLIGWSVTALILLTVAACAFIYALIALPVG